MSTYQTFGDQSVLETTARSARAPHVIPSQTSSPLLRAYLDMRQRSMELTKDLSAEDQVVQAMDDASPTKWHLGHTSWFFERFILIPHGFTDGKDYVCFDDDFEYCFNSYYEAIGPRHPRPKRGLLTRPSLEQVHDFRMHIDAAMAQLILHAEAAKTHKTKQDSTLYDTIAPLVTLGIHHEQQHQELLLTDILSLFSANPLRPAYRGGARPPELKDKTAKAAPLQWVSFDGGIHPIGHADTGENESECDEESTLKNFCYDNEGPRHDQLIRPFKLAHRCVTNGEWLEFINDKGYDSVHLWLSDGWATRQSEAWCAPLYWEQRDGQWMQMSLHGLHDIVLSAPVTHISYYEADAFARWSGKRLPSEFEWEYAATQTHPDPAKLQEGANIGTNGAFAPLPATSNPSTPNGLTQMFGDVWEWTQSAYLPYPGFQPAAGAVGEYNGKFMCNQFVLRGGSCITPQNHIRSTYRNFFYPFQRWQFTGLRLAEDI